ncbi:hypothetical protein [Halegenticoccus soli]|uniref:hypothetical protein n=1 Tax=Halegenticoccus soli TaxID=1985678 RepID=UPI000C6CF074|nr:hypothetical protein [Halegenticoccus soli]
MLFRFPTENEIAYHYPTASTVEEYLERAQADPDDHYHFASSLRSIYQWIVLADQFDEDPHEKIDDLLDNLSVTHPSISAAVALTEWETERNYYEAISALHLLYDTLEEADAMEWHHVAKHVLTWLLKTEKELNRDSSTILNDIVRYCDDHFYGASDLPLNTYHELVSLIYENHYDADEQALLRIFVITLQQANRYASNGESQQERMLLEDALELAKVVGIDQRGVARRYVETYHSEAALQSDPVVRGGTLLRGLEDSTVSSTLSDAEKQEWKREMNEAFRSGAKQLRRKGTPLHTNDMDDAFRSDVQRNTQLFKLLAARHSRKGAIYWFATQNKFLPAEDTDRQPLLDRISTVAPSDTGHVVRQTPDGDEIEVTQSYLTNLSVYAPLAPQTLFELVNEGVVTRGLLYQIFFNCESISADDRWYAISFITALWEKRYGEAIHLGIPRLESMMFNVLQSKGEDVDALFDSGTGTRTLGSLLDVLENYVDQRFHKYLKYMYNDRLGELAGGNLRNRTAHGHLRMGEDNAFIAYLILTDLLRLIIRTDLIAHRAEFGLLSEYELLDQFLD